jgi:hypothetical protein
MVKQAEKLNGLAWFWGATPSWRTTSPTRQRGTLVFDVTVWDASSGVLRWRVRLVYSATSKLALRARRAPESCKAI